MIEDNSIAKQEDMGFKRDDEDGKDKIQPVDKGIQVDFIQSSQKPTTNTMSSEFINFALQQSRSLLEDIPKEHHSFCTDVLVRAAILADPTVHHSKLPQISGLGSKDISLAFQAKYRSILEEKVLLWSRQWDEQPRTPIDIMDSIHVIASEKRHASVEDQAEKKRRKYDIPYEIQTTEEEKYTVQQFGDEQARLKDDASGNSIDQQIEIIALRRQQLEEQRTFGSLNSHQVEPVISRTQSTKSASSFGDKPIDNAPETAIMFGSDAEGNKKKLASITNPSSSTGIMNDEEGLESMALDESVTSPSGNEDSSENVAGEIRFVLPAAKQFVIESDDEEEISIIHEEEQDALANSSYSDRLDESDPESQDMGATYILESNDNAEEISFVLPKTAQIHALDVNDATDKHDSKGKMEETDSACMYDAEIENSIHGDESVVLATDEDEISFILPIPTPTKELRQVTPISVHKHLIQKLHEKVIESRSYRKLAMNSIRKEASVSGEFSPNKTEEGAKIPQEFVSRYMIRDFGVRSKSDANPVIEIPEKMEGVSDQGSSPQTQDSTPMQALNLSFFDKLKLLKLKQRKTPEVKPIEDMNENFVSFN
jgi:hypothetical protein